MRSVICTSYYCSMYYIAKTSQCEVCLHLPGVVPSWACGTHTHPWATFWVLSSQGCGPTGPGGGLSSSPASSLAPLGSSSSSSSFLVSGKGVNNWGGGGGRGLEGRRDNYVYYVFQWWCTWGWWVEGGGGRCEVRCGRSACHSVCKCLCSRNGLGAGVCTTMYASVYVCIPKDFF